MSLIERVSSILDRIAVKKGTIKSLVMEDSHPNKKAIYALLCETLKYADILTILLEKTGCVKTFKHLSANARLVIAYEIVLGKGLKKLPPNHQKQWAKFESKLKAEFIRTKVRRGAASNEALLSDDIRALKPLPRYVRVNTLLSSIKAVQKHFIQLGYTLALESSELKKKTFSIDSFMPNMLVFYPNTDLHDDALLKKGHIILQDKASCLPALALSPPLGSVCMDACAAPGNKTSHLSALLENTGLIYALDKDPKRLATLETLTKRAGCKNLQPMRQDFLLLNPKEYPDVEYILLDPSCSGSGIVSRLDALVVNESESTTDRIESLSEFQKRAILHAFSFPNVKRVVYSTCSKHSEENEDVVKYCLENSNFKLVPALVDWPTRGLPLVEHSECLVRADSVTNETIGFFVALFEAPSASSN